MWILGLKGLSGFDRSRECFPAILTPPTFCKVSGNQKFNKLFNSDPCNCFTMKAIACNRGEQSPLSHDRPLGVLV